MIGAITREESRKTNWRVVGETFGSRARREPNGRRRGAVIELLELVDKVRNGNLSADAALTAAIDQVAADRENLVSRVLYAVIQDGRTFEDAAIAPGSATTATSSAASGSSDPARRFEAMREVVEGPSPVTRAELYTHSLFRCWQQSLEGFFTRPDVRASIGWQSQRFMREELRHWQWTTLPIVARRLQSLAADLRVAGQETEAAACERWLALCAIGILKTETDAPTRLLAADILAMSISDPRSPVRAGAEKFRRDFHDAAALAPVDPCSQSFTGAHSMAPSEYGTATMRLFASIAAGTMALGAGIFLIVLLALLPVVAIVRLRRGTAEVSRGEMANHRRWTAPAAAAAVVGFSVAVITTRFHLDQYYSLSSVIYLSIVLGGAGAAGAVLISVMRRPAFPIGLGLVALFVALLAMPISVHAWTARFFGLSLGSELVAAAIVAGVVGTAAILGGASLRSLASAAAKIWLVGIVLSLVLYQFHAAADRKYQVAAAAGYADEVAVRLGADWQQKYFAEAFARYDLPSP